MTSQPPSDEGPVTGSYTVGRLDDVSTRLARVEGEMKGFATKEDVANAKLQMTLTWVGIGVAILVAVLNIAAIIVFRLTASGGSP